MKIIIPFLFFVTILKAQNSDLKFNELTPLWSFELRDTLFGQSGVPYDTNTQYNQYNSLFPSQIKESKGKLFVYSTSINDNGNFYGGLLECYDSTNGELIWRNTFNKWTALDTQEVYSSINIPIDHSMVCIAGYRNPKGESIFPPWVGGSRAITSRRCFNITSGEQIIHDYDIQDKSGATQIISSNNYHYNALENSYYYFDQDSVSLGVDSKYYNKLSKFSPTFSLVEGEVIDTVAVPVKNVKFGNSGFGWSHSFSLNDSTYVFSRTFLYNDSTQNSSSLNYIDISNEEVKIRKSVDLTPFHRPLYLPSEFSHYAHNNKEVFLYANYQNSDVDTLMHTWFLWLDEYGNEKVYIPRLNKLDGSAYIVYIPLHISNAQIIFLALDRFSNNSKGDIIGIDSMGKVSYYTPFSSPIGEDLRVSPIKAGRANDGICYLSVEYDGKQNIVAFDLKELGIDVTSNTNDKPLSQNRFNIYPNPSDGIFFINNDKQVPFMAQVYNQQGNKILTIGSAFRNEIEIDLGTYSPGTYIINFLNLQGEIIDSKKILLVK